MSSGSIPADIASIVSDLKDVSFEQVVFETATNALHTKSKNIDIKFLSSYRDVTEKKD